MAAAGSLVLAAGGFYVIKETFDTVADCGETFELSNFRPRAYMDIGDQTFGLDTVSAFGEKTLKVRQGATYPELHQHATTSILLTLDDGRYTGEGVIPEAGKTLQVSIDSDLDTINTSCETN